MRIKGGKELTMGVLCFPQNESNLDLTWSSLVTTHSQPSGTMGGYPWIPHLQVPPTTSGQPPTAPHMARKSEPPWKNAHRPQEGQCADLGPVAELRQNQEEQAVVGSPLQSPCPQLSVLPPAKALTHRPKYFLNMSVWNICWLFSLSLFLKQCKTTVYIIFALY